MQRKPVTSRLWAGGRPHAGCALGAVAKISLGEGDIVCAMRRLCRFERQIGVERRKSKAIDRLGPEVETVDDRDARADCSLLRCAHRFTPPPFREARY